MNKIYRIDKKIFRSRSGDGYLAKQTVTILDGDYGPVVHIHKLVLIPLTEIAEWTNNISGYRLLKTFKNSGLVWKYFNMKLDSWRQMNQWIESKNIS